MSKKKILVVGDVMLDHYVYGEVKRISPEAPVPIIDFHNERYVPGGAANVAANLAALGAEPLIYGIVGRDQAADDLQEVLEKNGVLSGFFIRQKGRITTVKQRVYSGQQIVRIDKETHERLTKEQEKELCRTIDKSMVGAAAVVISDYAKGVVTQGVCDHLTAKCEKRKIPLLMNLKPGHALTPHKPFAIQVNRKEAFELALTFDDGSWPRLRDAAKMLAIRYEPRVIIVTLGSEGVYLYKVSDGETAHIATKVMEVVDVSGAGDTVLAAYTVGLLDGLTSESALKFANRAAGKVVAKHGTAVVKRDEL